MSKLILHPFLFAVFPALFLFSFNLGHVSTEHMLVPVYLITIVVLAGWLIFQRKYKDKYRSAMATSFFLILFFSYGHLFDLLPSEPIPLRQHWLFLVAWGLLFFIGLRYIKNTAANLQQINSGLNITAIALIVTPFLGNTFVQSTSLDLATDAHAGILPPIQTRHLATPDKRPDIYYIVLDAYARADILQNIFDHDNSPFLNFLQDKGFSIASKSRANYNQTWLALSSSLNLTYLNPLVGTYGIQDRNRTPLKYLIQNNTVVPFLKKHGYKFVSFQSGQSFTNMETADISMPARKDINEFNVTLLSSTPLPGFFYEMGRLFGKTTNAYQAHRDRINYAFDHLPDLAGKETPIFVFAHILAPHPPFVFGPDGEPIDPDRRYWIGDGSAFFDKGGTMEEYLRNYTGEVKYLNKRLKETVERILAKSKEPPVIIIQSDHGSRLELDWRDVNNTNFQEAFSILSAFYLPNTSVQVPEGISPVNTFRFIFNTYFGTKYDLLEDRSYYSGWEEPYNFQEVTDKVT